MEKELPTANALVVSPVPQAQLLLTKRLANQANIVSLAHQQEQTVQSAPSTLVLELKVRPDVLRALQVLNATLQVSPSNPSSLLKVKRIQQMQHQIMIYVVSPTPTSPLSALTVTRKVPLSLILTLYPLRVHLATTVLSRLKERLVYSEYAQ